MAMAMASYAIHAALKRGSKRPAASDSLALSFTAISRTLASRPSPLGDRQMRPLPGRRLLPWIERSETASSARARLVLRACLSSDAPSSGSSAHAQGVGRLRAGPRPASAGVPYDGGKAAYSRMTSAELLRTLLTLRLVGFESVVSLSIRLLKSPVMDYPLLREFVHSMVKRTVYAHFCAGEDIQEASATLRRMWELGLTGILNYSLEDAMDNASCNSHLDVFLRTVHQTPLLPAGSVSFSCVKMTALCPIPLLERISDLLRWQHKHPGYNLTWKEEGLPILASESPTYHVQGVPEPLSQNEENDLLLAGERLWKICKESQEAGLPLLVDAEYTSVQPAIDYFAYVAALQFNKSGQPLVYGTFQAYLKDSLPRLTLAIAEATKRGISFGVKLVRGAYMTTELALAASLGAPSPIHSSIEETHKCYDSCAKFVLERAALGGGSVVLATHNFNSGRTAAAKAEELGMGKGDSKLQFAQLKGMADGLSLGLVNAGFQVSKYLAFGPVDHVIPYLIRRAEENQGMLGSTSEDMRKIRLELKRRLLELIPL